MNRRIAVTMAVCSCLLVLASSPADAICATARVFGSIESYILTPGVDPAGPAQSSITADFEGSFWALGFGDPEQFFGKDNGGFPAIAGFDAPRNASWFLLYPGYPALMHSHWAANPLIDGCIDEAIAGGGPPCMVVSFGDQDGGAGYFAILSDLGDAISDFDFNQPGGAPIDLVPVPEPSVRETVPVASGELEVLLDPPQPGAGLYLDPACEERIHAVRGYRIYGRQLPAGSLAPEDRSAGSGWIAATDVIPLSDGATVRISCDDETDVYLALALAYDSGYETPYLSRNAEVIRCRACAEGTDSDGDGFCAESAGLPPGDCDDADASTFPGAAQVCDGINNDCDDPEWPLVPAAEADSDGDGFRVCPERVIVLTLEDCDDADAGVGPLAHEVCNGVDDDCDGMIDEDSTGLDTDQDGVPNACDNCVSQGNPGQSDGDDDGVGDACDDCLDLDADGYGNPGHEACPAGAETDCDDGDRFIGPGAPEVYDGRDNDCDGLTDEGLDDDGDGIPNFRDRCPNTPPNLAVNPHGCLERWHDITFSGADSG